MLLIIVADSHGNASVENGLSRSAMSLIKVTDSESNACVEVIFYTLAMSLVIAVGNVG